MAITHATTKAAGQKLFAVADWNAAHVFSASDFAAMFHALAMTLKLALPYTGTIASIPAGWQLCNGTNGTPDLRDKFVVGAKQDSGGVAKTNVTGSLLQSGGNISHTHTISGDTASGNANVSDAGHDHGIDAWTDMSMPPMDGETISRASVTDSANANVSDSGHTHGKGTLANATTQHVNPFYALAYIAAV